MEFKISKKELCVLNSFLKSITIKDSLYQDNIKVGDDENAEIIESLYKKALLHKDTNGNFKLAKNVLPYQKVFDFADCRVLNVIEITVEKGTEYEVVDIFSIKKGHIGVCVDSGENIYLKYFDLDSLNLALSEYLNVDEITSDDPLPPFILTLSMKNLEAFLTLYEKNQTEAINQYSKIFGVTSQELSMIASIIVKNESPTYFIVQSEKDTCLYKICKNNGVSIVICRKKQFMQEKVLISHQYVNDFVKWLGIKRGFLFKN
jgi:hypothetical protein